MTRAEYQRAYYLAHKAERSAQKKAWRAANIEKVQAKESAYRAAHREEIAALRRAYYAEHKSEIKERRKSWDSCSPEAVAYYAELSGAKRRERMLVDPEFYAKQRAYVRKYQRNLVDKNRKRKFVERPAGRIPDWMTKADVQREVARSTFNWANMADERDSVIARRNYGAELYRERWGLDD